MKSSTYYNRWTTVISIVIPIAVAMLFRIKITLDLPVFLPPIYATINGITALLLILSFRAIKKKKVILHKKLMITSLILGALFLMMYVLHHITSDPVSYGGEGAVRYLYYFLLISHILLSVGVIPFVLISFTRAITNNITMHKKIARIAFPIWLYVAISGVIVYLMIAPYYS